MRRKRSETPMAATTLPSAMTGVASVPGMGMDLSYEKK
jgi:hypothetical protein